MVDLAIVLCALAWAAFLIQMERPIIRGMMWLAQQQRRYL